MIQKLIIQDSYIVFLYDDRILLVGQFVDFRTPYPDTLAHGHVTTLECNFVIKKSELNKNSICFLSSDGKVYIYGRDKNGSMNLGLGKNVREKLMA